MEIASADLAPIRELYARGLYLQALKRAEAIGPFSQWSNTAARLMGGRLVIQLAQGRHEYHLGLGAGPSRIDQCDAVVAANRVGVDHFQVGQRQR